MRATGNTANSMQNMRLTGDLPPVENPDGRDFQFVGKVCQG